MRFIKLAALLAAAVLAGCQAPPPPAPVAETPRGAGLARGIDIPTDASDVVSELKGSRMDFVARYYRDPASRWPTLTAGEAQRLSALGLKIVTVWESHSHNPAYFSYASGYNDALNAHRQAKAVGQPAGSAVYFAVDFNTDSAQLYFVDQYFRGIAAGFAAASGGRPDYKVGVYGSGAVCGAIRQAGLAQYSWLSGSRAWAGSSSYGGWNIRQSTRWSNLTFNHDANEAKEDYGGFQLATAAPAVFPPEPAAPPQPPPSQGLAGIFHTWF